MRGQGPKCECECECECERECVSNSLNSMNQSDSEESGGVPVSVAVRVLSVRMCCECRISFTYVCIRRLDDQVLRIQGKYVSVIPLFL